MNIYDLIDNLKSSLDNEDVIKEIRLVQNKIIDDATLYEKVKLHDFDNNNQLIRQYKHLENEVNYIIFSINRELKLVFKGDKNEHNTR